MRRKSSLNPEEVIHVENIISNITYVPGSGLDVAMETVKRVLSKVICWCQ